MDPIQEAREAAKLQLLVELHCLRNSPLRQASLNGWPLGNLSYGDTGRVTPKKSISGHENYVHAYMLLFPNGVEIGAQKSDLQIRVEENQLAEENDTLKNYDHVLLDVFAGGGCTSVGFAAAGVAPIMIVERDTAKIESYMKNINRPEVDNPDILRENLKQFDVEYRNGILVYQKDVNPDDIEEDSTKIAQALRQLMDASGLDVLNLHVHGSPSCHGASVLSYAADKQSKGKCFAETKTTMEWYVRLIKSFQNENPCCPANDDTSITWSLENGPRLLTEMKSQLSNTTTKDNYYYFTEYLGGAVCVLDMSAFNVPQSRIRTIAGSKHFIKNLLMGNLEIPNTLNKEKEAFMKLIRETPESPTGWSPSKNKGISIETAYKLAGKEKPSEFEYFRTDNWSTASTILDELRREYTDNDFKQKQEEIKKDEQLLSRADYVKKYIKATKKNQARSVDMVSQTLTAQNTGFGCMLRRIDDGGNVYDPDKTWKDLTENKTPVEIQKMMIDGRYWFIQTNEIYEDRLDMLKIINTCPLEMDFGGEKYDDKIRHAEKSLGDSIPPLFAFWMACAVTSSGIKSLMQMSDDILSLIFRRTKGNVHSTDISRQVIIDDLVKDYKEYLRTKTDLKETTRTLYAQTISKHLHDTPELFSDIEKMADSNRSGHNTLKSALNYFIIPFKSWLEQNSGNLGVLACFFKITKKKNYLEILGKVHPDKKEQVKNLLRNTMGGGILFDDDNSLDELFDTLTKIINKLKANNVLCNTSFQIQQSDPLHIEAGQEGSYSGTFIAGLSLDNLQLVVSYPKQKDPVVYDPYLTQSELNAQTTVNVAFYTKADIQSTFLVTQEETKDFLDQLFISSSDSNSNFFKPLLLACLFCVGLLDSEQAILLSNIEDSFEQGDNFFEYLEKLYQSLQLVAETFMPEHALVPLYDSSGTDPLCFLVPGKDNKTVVQPHLNATELCFSKKDEQACQISNLCKWDAPHNACLENEIPVTSDDLFDIRACMRRIKRQLASMNFVQVKQTKTQSADQYTPSANTYDRFSYQPKNVINSSTKVYNNITNKFELGRTLPVFEEENRGALHFIDDVFTQKRESAVPKNSNFNVEYNYDIFRQYVRDPNFVDSVKKFGELPVDSAESVLNLFWAKNEENKRKRKELFKFFKKKESKMKRYNEYGHCNNSVYKLDVAYWYNVIELLKVTFKDKHINYLNLAKQISEFLKNEIESLELPENWHNDETAGPDLEQIVNEFLNPSYSKEKSKKVFALLQQNEINSYKVLHPLFHTRMINIFLKLEEFIGLGKKESLSVWKHGMENNTESKTFLLYKKYKNPRQIQFWSMLLRVKSIIEPMLDDITLSNFTDLDDFPDTAEKQYFFDAFDYSIEMFSFLFYSLKGSEKKPKTMLTQSSDREQTIESKIQSKIMDYPSYEKFLKEMGNFSREHNIINPKRQCQQIFVKEIKNFLTSPVYWYRGGVLWSMQASNDNIDVCLYYSGFETKVRDLLYSEESMPEQGEFIYFGENKEFKLEKICMISYTASGYQIERNNTFRSQGEDNSEKSDLEDVLEDLAFPTDKNEPIVAISHDAENSIKQRAVGFNAQTSSFLVSHLCNLVYSHAASNSIKKLDANYTITNKDVYSNFLGYYLDIIDLQHGSAFNNKVSDVPKAFLFEAMNGIESYNLVEIERIRDTEPTADPTLEPTAEPTNEPTLEPTAEPTADPTLAWTRAFTIRVKDFVEETQKLNSDHAFKRISRQSNTKVVLGKSSLLQDQLVLEFTRKSVPIFANHQFEAFSISRQVGDKSFIYNPCIVRQQLDSLRQNFHTAFDGDLNSFFFKEETVRLDQFPLQTCPRPITNFAVIVDCVMSVMRDSTFSGRLNTQSDPYTRLYALLKVYKQSMNLEFSHISEIKDKFSSFLEFTREDLEVEIKKPLLENAEVGDESQCIGRLNSTFLKNYETYHDLVYRYRNNLLKFMNSPSVKLLWAMTVRQQQQNAGLLSVDQFCDLAQKILNIEQPQKIRDIVKMELKHPNIPDLILVYEPRYEIVCFVDKILKPENAGSDPFDDINTFALFLNAFQDLPKDYKIDTNSHVHHPEYFMLCDDNEVRPYISLPDVFCHALKYDAYNNVYGLFELIEEEGKITIKKGNLIWATGIWTTAKLSNLDFPINTYAGDSEKKLLCGNPEEDTSVVETRRNLTDVVETSALATCGLPKYKNNDTNPHRFFIKVVSQILGKKFQDIRGESYSTFLTYALDDRTGIFSPLAFDVPFLVFKRYGSGFLYEALVSLKMYLPVDPPEPIEWYYDKKGGTERSNDDAARSTASSTDDDINNYVNNNAARSTTPLSQQQINYTRPKKKDHVDNDSPYMLNVSRYFDSASPFEYQNPQDDDAYLDRYVSFYLTAKQDVVEMREKFDALDRDGDGSISFAELASVLRALYGDSVEDEILLQAASDTIDAYYVDGDGNVSWDEFVRVTEAVRRRVDSVDYFTQIDYMNSNSEPIDALTFKKNFDVSGRDSFLLEPKAKTLVELLADGRVQPSSLDNNIIDDLDFEYQAKNASYPQDKLKCLTKIRTFCFGKNEELELSEVFNYLQIIDPEGWTKVKSQKYQSSHTLAFDKNSNRKFYVFNPPSSNFRSRLDYLENPKASCRVLMTPADIVTRGIFNKQETDNIKSIMNLCNVNVQLFSGPKTVNLYNNYLRLVELQMASSDILSTFDKLRILIGTVSNDNNELMFDIFALYFACCPLIGGKPENLDSDTLLMHIEFELLSLFTFPCKMVNMITAHINDSLLSVQLIGLMSNLYLISGFTNLLRFPSFYNIDFKYGQDVNINQSLLRFLDDYCSSRLLKKTLVSLGDFSSRNKKTRNIAFFTQDHVSELGDRDLKLLTEIQIDAVSLSDAHYHKLLVDLLKRRTKNGNLTNTNPLSFSDYLELHSGKISSDISIADLKAYLSEARRQLDLNGTSSSGGDLLRKAYLRWENYRIWCESLVFLKKVKGKARQTVLDVYAGSSMVQIQPGFLFEILCLCKVLYEPPTSSSPDDNGALDFNKWFFNQIPFSEPQPLNTLLVAFATWGSQSMPESSTFTEIVNTLYQNKIIFPLENLSPRGAFTDKFTTGWISIHKQVKSFYVRMVNCVVSCVYLWLYLGGVWSPKGIGLLKLQLKIGGKEIGVPKTYVFPNPSKDDNFTQINDSKEFVSKLQDLKITSEDETSDLPPHIERSLELLDMNNLITDSIKTQIHDLMQGNELKFDTTVDDIPLHFKFQLKDIQLRDEDKLKKIKDFVPFSPGLKSSIRLPVLKIDEWKSRQAVRYIEKAELERLVGLNSTFDYRYQLLVQSKYALDLGRYMRSIIDMESPTLHLKFAVIEGATMEIPDSPWIDPSFWTIELNHDVQEDGLMNFTLQNDGKDIKLGVLNKTLDRLYIVSFTDEGIKSIQTIIKTNKSLVVFVNGKQGVLRQLALEDQIKQLLLQTSTVPSTPSKLDLQIFNSFEGDKKFKTQWLALRGKWDWSWFHRGIPHMCFEFLRHYLLPTQEMQRDFIRSAFRLFFDQKHLYDKSSDNMKKIIDRVIWSSQEQIKKKFNNTYIDYENYRKDIEDQLKNYESYEKVVKEFLEKNMLYKLEGLHEKYFLHEKTWEYVNKRLGGIEKTSTTKELVAEVQPQRIDCSFNKKKLDKLIRYFNLEGSQNPTFQCFKLSFPAGSFPQRIFSVNSLENFDFKIGEGAFAVLESTDQTLAVWGNQRVTFLGFYKDGLFSLMRSRDQNCVYRSGQNDCAPDCSWLVDAQKCFPPTDTTFTHYLYHITASLKEKKELHLFQAAQAGASAVFWINTLEQEEVQPLSKKPRKGEGDTNTKRKLPQETRETGSKRSALEKQKSQTSTKRKIKRENREPDSKKQHSLKRVSQTSTKPKTQWPPPVNRNLDGIEFPYFERQISRKCGWHMLSHLLWGLSPSNSRNEEVLKFVKSFKCGKKKELDNWDFLDFFTAFNKKFKYTPLVMISSRIGNIENMAWNQKLHEIPSFYETQWDGHIYHAKEVGYILNPGDHWLALRSFQNSWYLLDSIDEKTTKPLESNYDISKLVSAYGNFYRVYQLNSTKILFEDKDKGKEINFIYQNFYPRMGKGHDYEVFYRDWESSKMQDLVQRLNAKNDVVFKKENILGTTPLETTIQPTPPDPEKTVEQYIRINNIDAQDGKYIIPYFTNTFVH